MAQILKLIAENTNLKKKIEDYRQAYGCCPLIDDSILKGSIRVVKTIEERNKIQCCYRKQGMQVIVVGSDLSFKEYRLLSSTCANEWEEIIVNVDIPELIEENILLTEDYSELAPDLETQQDLNLVLQSLLINLQSQINDLELIDESVQLTENTNFGSIGENQKQFNKQVSDFKDIIEGNLDLKLEILLTGE